MTPSSTITLTLPSAAPVFVSLSTNRIEHYITSNPVLINSGSSVGISAIDIDDSGSPEITSYAESNQVNLGGVNNSSIDSSSTSSTSIVYLPAGTHRITAKTILFGGFNNDCDDIFGGPSVLTAWVLQ